MTWLGRVWRRWMDRQGDAAWKATGIRQVYAGYDRTKAEAGARRARALEQRGAVRRKAAR